MPDYKGRYQTKAAPGDTTAKQKVILNIKKDDEVMVLQGDDKGRKGKVLRTIPHKRQVVVQNLNQIWKHLRRSQQNPQGGRIHKEAPLPISKVAVVCQSCGQPTRVHRRRKDDQGNKVAGGVRFCGRRECGKPVSAK